MRASLTFGVALLALTACSSHSGDPLTRSCKGRAVSSCLPFEYTAVRSATLEPSGLDVGELLTRATVHVELETCGADAPGSLIVKVIAVASADDPFADSGMGDGRFPLLELRDDGMSGDAVAGDDVIDKGIPNPFDNRLLPPNTDLVLRFEPQRTATCSGGSCTGGTCAGTAFELPYRTGVLAPRPAVDAGVGP